jgi:PAS domain S-box-containing protein
MTAPSPSASLLLVDDHPADLLTLDAVLAPLGHRLVSAGSGEEALALAAREEFAVILLDVRMPGLDGFATVERIRESEHGRSTPVIFLSAHEKDRDGILRAYDLGAVDYLTKPFEHAMLRSKVRVFADLYLARRRAREQAERAEGRERALLDRFLERAPACLAIFEGPEHRFVYANACFRAMAGGPALGDLLGRSAREALPGLGGGGFFERLDRAYASGEAGAGVDAPIRWAREAGGPGADISFTVHPYRGPGGRVAGIMTFGFDVSDLVLARTRAEALASELARGEARFRTFVESIPLLAWSASPDGVIDYYNSRWYAYTGLAPGTVQGGPSMMHPEHADEVMAAWRRSMASGADFERETLIRRADGVYRWHLVRAVPVRDEGGRVLRWFGTSTDIDDHKRVEAEREALYAREREARALAEEASRAKDEFLATVSHELRTPLNAVLGWARLLRGGGGHAQIERALEVIERNALAQAKLVDDLLDVSRLASGRVRLKRERVALAAAVRDALDTLAPAAQAKRLAIEVEVDDEGEVVGDADRLQQVAWNLVSNAVKFSPAGASVRVVVRRDGGDVVLTVADGGPGIPPSFLPHVFDPFRQADGSITRLHGGLGVGLSIARQFAELHGGSIAAESGGERAGAAFTVRLPAAPPSEPRREAASLPGEGGASLRGLRVLVVDDEPDACDLARAILGAAGAEVVTALDADAALRALIAWAPDVLVSDVGMPGTDGYAFLRRVRRLSDRVASRTPAVALTAFVRAEDRLRALEAGFNAYVPKPVDPDELTLAVAGAARPPR